MSGQKYYPDFFNDVFGPVMQPGSSSHTAGPCRIGYEAFCLLGEEPAEIVVRLDEEGSYSGTFGLMSEDLGMLAGAVGMLPDDIRIFDIYSYLRERGIVHRFERTRLTASRHPNAVEFVLTGRDGRTVSLTGNSTGGGMIEIVDLSGRPVHYIGDRELTGEIEGHPFVLKPILPVASDGNRKEQLFDTMETWRLAARERGISLPQAAVLYEQGASGLSGEEIRSRMQDLMTLMRRQTEAVYASEDGLLETPFSGFGFREWRSYTGGKAGPLSGDVEALTLRYVFGVQALMRGVTLVPGPMGTGGGFLFAALRAVQEARRFPEDVLLDALLVAAGVGAISYTRGNPTGEIMGCAGECGVCGAMAAAGICQMAGGTPKQVENAASLALQMAVGWPCDPIPGGGNQPCASRFTAAAVMAVTFADLALSGRDAVLPYHEVFDAAREVSAAMHEDLLCTSRGGMCRTQTAEERRRAFDRWFRERRQT